MFDLNEYLRQHRRTRYSSGVWLYAPHPRIVCADGFSLSTQAGPGLGSQPEAYMADSYTHVEVGYPSEWDESLAPYGDRDEDVYFRVPVEVVEALVEQHGGFSHAAK